MATKYYDIEKGTCLLRANETPTKLQFDVMDKTGQWRDGSSLGVRYTVSGDEMGADEIDAAAAGRLAKKLGGKL